MDALTIGRVARGAGLAIDAVRVLYDPAAVDAARLVTAIEKAGYKVKSAA